MRLLITLLAVCSALAQSPNGVNFVSIPKEIEMGKNLAAEMQTSLEAQPDARLQAIGDRLAANTDGVFQYTFFAYSKVSPESEPKALPGGPVFVARNMISTEDAVVAAILAHAMGHIALRHYTRAMTQMELEEIGAKAALHAITVPNPVVVQTTSFKAAALHQAFELDADLFALKLMPAAGYDPQALVQWLQSLPVPISNLALGDRPMPSRRVAAVQHAIQAAQ
jgi:predicted Zn-dependent protease